MKMHEMVNNCKGAKSVTFGIRIYAEMCVIFMHSSIVQHRINRRYEGRETNVCFFDKSKSW